ncbi:MarR family winged helix-turn-helix transcriptional regulator [Falsirhodobacter algicola]|uniref:MarR family transcriptional regulator n=1 Tax=Falsirhodobacter algicola TaxID=2692330 RepID=A0A8J8MTC1_9RHOB|nr:MarR family winged helix-turn-helix transcriptional regulator [Falsirhodobacter algicola]QUS36290.1 MarR family transcriptional regulator [Falsirhodobacter algicola]
MLTPIGIRPKQARILNVLNRIGPSSQKMLSEQFGVTSGSMSTMIDRLVAAGLVHREKHPDDKRTDVVSLSKRGRDALIKVRDVWREIDDLITEKLGAEKAGLFFDLTRELKYKLGGQVIGRPDHPVQSMAEDHPKSETGRTS